MTLYVVRQYRPYWVCLTQEIEAHSEEEAEDKFYDEFDPEFTIDRHIPWVDESGLTIEPKT